MKDSKKDNCNIAPIVKDIDLEYKERYGFHDDVKSDIDMGKGLSEDVVKAISKLKGEDEWMLDIRLKAYEHFKKMELPKWGPSLSKIDLKNIHYYVKASDKRHSWDEVPKDIKDTFERLGIPEAERKYLAGVATQYESEVVYHNLKVKWDKMGVIFLDTDEGYKRYPELFKKYFNKIVPFTDNKFSALNTAVWSGGTFIYIPKGLKLKIPLQTYFRINSKNMGQFERTLIIADEGSEVSYIEGCTAPIYSSDSLHAAVVEVVVLKNARVRYTTIQNWSTNVYNLVTKRALVRENGIMEWIDCNLGSKITMKYPSVYLTGKKARGEILSIAVANKDQHLDNGAKAIHIAPQTKSVIRSRSICLNGGRSSYRGLVNIRKGAKGSRSDVTCDALILDSLSQTDTYPTNITDETDSTITHEAIVGRLNQEQLQYLMSKGLDRVQASSLIVSGFIEPFIKELPMEYAMELNSLIKMNMEGSVA